MNIKERLQKALNKKNINIIIENIEITEEETFENLTLKGKINNIYFEKNFMGEDYEKIDLKGEGLKFFIKNMKNLYEQLSKINIIKKENQKFLEYKNIILPFEKELEGKTDTYVITSKKEAIQRLWNEYNNIIDTYGDSIGDNEEWYNQIIAEINKLPEDTIIIFAIDENQIYLPGEKFFIDILEEIKENNQLNNIEKENLEI